ncbi:MAG TPA: aminotransferase class I/II-fold pyridoxal phosphate-dependent enzyme [Campylobacterales bacterium]|nr:aminotransferase class I/II-fold pyridoxal phosphate-dependent enzyme [Campylobacterales bacterium]
MKEYAHGADTAGFAKAIGARQDEIIDFSSNINFVKPCVDTPNGFGFLSAYNSDDYATLRAGLEHRYGVQSQNIELYNGASAAIFSLFSFLKPSCVALYAPIYLEYKKIAALQNADITLIDRFSEPKQPKRGSLVVFVNPSTPDGALYDAAALLREWVGLDCTVVVDESFLDFTDGASLMGELENYENLYVVKSLTKYYGAAGVRVGFVASSAKNIAALKSREPLWKLSSFDAYYMATALNDNSFDARSKEQNDANRELLRKTLESSGLFEHIFEGKANYLCARLSGLSIAALQEILAREKMLIRDCSNFDALGSGYARFAVRGEADILALRLAIGGKHAKVESKEKRKEKFLKDVQASLKDAKEGRAESIADIGRHIEELKKLK